ncbi:hypothetical protein Trydic_g3743, partial [Trypoxylus dichotomus]
EDHDNIIETPSITNFVHGRESEDQKATVHQRYLPWRKMPLDRCVA